MMTRKQLAACRRNAKIAHSLPRTKKQLEALRRNSKIGCAMPRTERQLKSLAKARKVGQKVLSTMSRTWLKGKNRYKYPNRLKADLKNIQIANSQPKTAKQRATSREMVKYAHEGLKKRRKEINGICELCGVPCFTYGDHCHKTGKKRGKVCLSCNLVLGMFKDDIGRFKKAIKYLEKYKVLRFPRLPQRFPRLKVAA